MLWSAAAPGRPQMESAMFPVFKIEVDMFSGRPNPGLELRGSEARQLKQLLELKRQPLNESTNNDQLGFRGFVIHSESPNHETYRVRGEIIEMGGKTFRDPAKQTQRYIVSILPKDLKAMLLPVLQSDVQ